MGHNGLIIISIILIFFSCSKDIQKSSSVKEVVVFPSPPDTAKVQFLTSFSNSQQVINKKSSFAKFITGEDAVMAIKKPYGISIHEGKIFICDADIAGLEILDLENQTFEYFNPRGFGQLKLPINCFVDDEGYLYVADVNRHQVVKFNKEREYVGSFGETNNYKPTDVFVKDGKIWVANIINNKIHVYKNDSSYQLLYTFPKVKEDEVGFLYQPTNLFVTENWVYVSDFGDFRIKIYNHQGDFVKSIGSYGTNMGQFTRPKGIAVDKESNLFVVDAAFENVQIFNAQQQLLMFFGGHYNGPGGMWLPAKVILDYDNLKYFQNYVYEGFELKYLILVSNQYGPDKINVYGFIEQIR